MEGCCIGLGTIHESLVGAKVRTWVQNETRNKDSILAIHNHVGIKFSISCHLGVGASVEAGSQLAGTQTCKPLSRACRKQQARSNGCYAPSSQHRVGTLVRLLPNDGIVT